MRPVDPSLNLLQGIEINATPSSCKGDFLHKDRPNTKFLLESVCLQHGYEPLPLARDLGLPLRRIKLPALGSQPRGHNMFLTALNIIPEFGRMRLEQLGMGYPAQGILGGTYTLIRDDGRPFVEEHARALAVYIDDTMQAIDDYMRIRNEEQLEEFEGLVKGKLNPEAFAEYWHEYQANKVRSEGESSSWASMWCPVIPNLADAPRHKGKYDGLHFCHRCREDRTTAPCSPEYLQAIAPALARLKANR